MGRWWRTNACDRAAQWVSLGLDGELSQLERAALDRHLDECARCRVLAADVTSFTELLREAPPVELSRPIVVRAPQRIRVVRRAAASLALAGAVAAATLGIVLPTSTGSSESALSFRTVQEQKQFAHIEARRLEPAVFLVPQEAVPPLAPHVLV